MSGESIKVCCRFRKEASGNEDEYDEWEFDESGAEIKLRDKKWTYDYILDHHTEQEDMYDKVAKQTISDFMNGFNGTIFAYGQSGSGKTFSMLGPEDVTDALSKDITSVPEKVTQLYGITPRAVIQMFEMINGFVSQGSSCTLLCSYIEIYNEKIKCLLSKKDDLKIREQPGMGMNVADKDVRVCKTPEEIFECVSLASKNRAVTGTLQNSRSSRSHTILLMEFEYNGIDGVKRSSRLNLVDLAGSERISKTGVEGAALKEAQKINQSLTTLGMCIMALTTPGSKHIPFRNSKLTLILKESLGGNSKTTLLCTASRRKIHNEESAQTLYFASRAKSIKNNCKSNVQMGAKELQYVADHMKKEIMILRGQMKKGGLNFNVITDPKLLAFISNDEIDNDGEVQDNSNSLTGSSSTSGSDDVRRRRVSLINLNERDIIIKYCELRAKYDNLLESAGNTINRLSNNQQNRGDSSEFNALRTETDEKLAEIIESKNAEVNSLLEKIETLKKGSDNLNDENNKKLQAILKEKFAAEEELENSKKEYDSLQEMFNLTQNDISFFQEKLAKKKKKNGQLKEDVKNLKSELTAKTEQIDELNKKSTENEIKNLENKKLIDELSNKNEILLLDFVNLKTGLKYKEDNENFLSTKNKELIDELNKNSELNALNEKKLNDNANKFSELEMKYKNDLEQSVNKENFTNTQLENLKKENENLSKMMQDKISDSELLNEKEKILNETKSVLEKRIDELSGENTKTKNELVETISKFNNEKNELASAIENLNREVKNKTSEIEQKQFDYESMKKNEDEKLKLEVQKSEQLSGRVENLEKKVFELETSNLAQIENEKKLANEKGNLERDLKEKHGMYELLKSDNERNITHSEKLEKDLKEQKEKFNEEKSKLKEEFDGEKKKLHGDIGALKSEIEIKSKRAEDGEKKIEEIKSEIKVLQGINQRLTNRVNELELDNTRSKRQSIMLQKETNSIKEKTPLNKNIFGVLLKKTDNQNIKNAIIETRNIQKEAENIFQDKINELRGLRENILSLSPKTVSSRSDIEDMPELDFQDEESFKKAEEILLEKEKAYQEEKSKKEAKEGAGMIKD